MKYIIASHGELAKGYKNTLKLLANIDNVDIVCAYGFEAQDIITQFDNITQNYDKDEEIYVFSDIFGGSVTQVAVKALENFNAHIIAGANLALILEIVLSNCHLQKEELKNKIELAKNEIVYINEII